MATTIPQIQILVAPLSLFLYCRQTLVYMTCQNPQILLCRISQVFVHHRNCEARQKSLDAFPVMEKCPA